MKILKVFIKNIHSLKGEHHINFNEGVLADAGLYAITGQTGAGKSTILDAITLSLYGETNRHGKGKADEIITRNEKESIAETTFEINHLQYMARWSVAYNRNNKLNDWELKFYEKTAEDGFKLLADKKSIALAEIQKTIGLTFEQFTKSVLLAQNNFAAFLKAKPAERAEMLSKITGTEIYETISKSVFEKTKFLEEEIALQKGGLNTNLLNEEEVQVFTENLGKNEQDLQAIQKELNAVLVSIKWLEDKQQTHFELANLKQKETEVLQQITDNEISYKKLAEFKKAQLIEKELQVFENALQLYEKNIIDLAAELEKSDKSKQKLVETDILFSNQNNKLIALKNELETKLPSINLAKETIIGQNNITKQITDLKSEFDDKNIDLQKFTQKQSEANEAQKTLTDSLLAKENSHKNLTIYSTWNEYSETVKSNYITIQKHEKYLAEHDLAALIKAIETLQKTIEIDQKVLTQQKEDLDKTQGRIDRLNLQQQGVKTTNELLANKDIIQQKLVNWEELNKLTKQRQEIEEKLIQNKELLASFTREEANFDNELTLLTNTQKLLQENWDLYLKIASLAEHREHLKPGEACPLCGALEHPLANENTSEKQNETKQKLSEVIEEIRIKNEAKNVVILRKIENQTAQTFNETELQNITNRITEITVSFGNDSIAGNFEETITKLTAELANIAADLSKNDLLEKAINHEAKALQILNNNWQKKQLENVKNEGDLTAKKQLLVNEQNQANEKTEAIKLAYDQLSKIFDSFNQKLPKNNIKEAKTIASQIDDNCKNFNQLITEITALKDKINTVNNELVQHETNIKSLNDWIGEFTKKKLEYEKQLVILSESIGQLTANFELKNPVEEENRLRVLVQQLENENNHLGNQKTVLETEILSLNNSIKKLEVEQILLQKNTKESEINLNEKLTVNGIENIENLKAALNLINHEEITQQQQTLANELNSVQTLLKNAKQKLNELTEQNLTDKQQVDLEIEKETLANRNTSINQEIGGIKEKLENDKSEKANNEKKLAEIFNKQKVFEKWEQLNKLIGSKTGDSFKKFAQDFTLSLLVQYANKHLEIMYNRYELFKDDNSAEMELQIKDKHFFEQVRSLNSLSGGETFLVSLALAIGLSDLASKNTKIRSLFIDEGFGSLDPESLNNALDALELLRQTDDRQIGIISHVEELKKRIHTQIKVTKISAEFSKISVTDE